ncbi:diguanylate cyclase domain-containing protein [Roseibium sediminis]|uniref:diguanylate cyclase domain-containing protein n=1 Tax=Roseibium sediminis TaxID=1775174 RepID=UPI00123D6F0F|nr:diguanylate cyclase [Roseibium sediminis]
MQKTIDASGGPSIKSSKQSISRLAFMLAGLLIAVCATSLLFVGQVASTASKYQTIQNEKARLQSAITNRLNMFVKEQLSVARSDVTIKELVRNFNVHFIQERGSRLWNDYGHNRAFVISPDDRIRVEVFEDYTHITNTDLADSPALVPLVARTRALFETNRVRVPGGYGHRSLLGLETEDYATAGFAVLDGRVAMVSAVPLMPGDHRVALPDPEPTILISAIFVDGGLLKDLNGELSGQGQKVLTGLGGSLALDGLTFKANGAVADDLPTWAVKSLSGEEIGAFEWTSKSQGASIWPTVIPVILLLSLALSFLAFGIAWRIGNLTNSLQESETRSRYLAHHDTLTGLANRLQFSSALEAAVANLSERPFVLMHCDLDRFKAVNDTYGHAAGDTVIKAVAERLRDVVGEHGLVGRIGGDEFVVLYTRTINRTTLLNLALDMITAVSKPVDLDETHVASVGLSVGIAIAPTDGKRTEQIIAASDAALYRSKGAGRGRAAFFEDDYVHEPPEAKKKAAAQSSGSKASDAA